MLLLLHEEALMEEDFLVFLIDFITGDSISHLFPYKRKYFTITIFIYSLDTIF